MSSIPAKSLDGDISVGRNSNIGGNAVVRGCATIGHNLKVEGWLHAPNIKGACKGYFLSLTDLNDAYPAPADGDYAFVSESGLPGPIYIAKNGVWTDSGKTGGPTLDINDIDDLRKEVAEYSGSIDAIDKAQETLRADFDTHVQNASKEIAAVKATADTAAAEVAIAKEQAAAAVSTANEANTTANEAKNAAQSANDKANAAKSEAETANTTASAAAKSAAAAAETAAGAVTAINTLKTENTTDHAAIRKEAADALAAHAAANDKAFADEASARKAVSDALAAHETADAADHAAIRKTLSDSLASAKQEQHDTLGISDIVAFDGFVGDVTDDTSTSAPIVRDPKGKVQQSAATVHFSTAYGNFLIKQDGAYYPKWDDDYLWQDRNQVPWSDKAYYNVNDGKLYKIGSDNQLHEIALTKLRDDIGILPCKVRMAAPLAEPTIGYPTAHNYTIWWSQTNKAFFAALGYDEAVAGDAIEGYEYYPLSVCDEYTDYCTLSGSGSTQTATPRTDRIYRSGNDLWQYDKAAGKMVKLGDVTGKDLTIRNLECNDATLQGDVEVAGILEVGDSGSLTVASGAGFYADNINNVRIDGRIDFVFHGIRQSLPTDYTAVAQSVSPKTRVDGSTYDIIYIRDKKRFVAVDDAAKTYAERFYDDEEYNIITNNKPTTARTDRAWRWGADLYKYDTEAYISAYKGNGKDLYGADLVCVTDAGKALFIKMWREAIYRSMYGVGKAGLFGVDSLGNCYVKNNTQYQLDYGGYYPEWHETPGFFINGITGISYAEARQIYDVRTCGPYPRKIADGGIIRTNMLCSYNYAAGAGQNGQGINTPFVFQSNDVQVIRVAAGLRGQRPTSSALIRGLWSFYDANNLEEVIGAVQVGNLGDNAFNTVFSPFKSKLKYLWITNLSVSLTKTFAKANNIDVDCLRYLVEKSQATAAKPISVTLHADVFAALPEDILTLAETKHVTFVSA